MTYDRSLFNSATPPPRDSIVTANDGVAQVTGAGSIALTLTFSLYNCLLALTIYTTLSVGQVIEKLSCVVQMFPSLC